MHLSLSKTIPTTLLTWELTSFTRSRYFSMCRSSAWRASSLRSDGAALRRISPCCLPVSNHKKDIEILFLTLIVCSLIANAKYDQSLQGCIEQSPVLRLGKMAWNVRWKDRYLDTARSLLPSCALSDNSPSKHMLRTSDQCHFHVNNLARYTAFSSIGSTNDTAALSSLFSCVFHYLIPRIHSFISSMNAYKA